MSKGYSVVIKPYEQNTKFSCGPASFMVILSAFAKKRPIYRDVTEGQVILYSGASQDGVDEKGIKKAITIENVVLSYRF